MNPGAKVWASLVDGVYMTAERRVPNHTTTEGRQLRLAPATLACHLAIVCDGDGCLSWHVARLDLASRRMVFPMSGITEAPTDAPNKMITALCRALSEAMDLERLMQH